MEQKGLKVKRIDIGSTLDPVTVENAALAKANLTVERVDAATEEEIIQAGRVFAKAYYRGRDNSESYAESEASNVRSRIHHFARQAEEFGKMGYPLPGGATSSIAGCSTNGAAVVRALEQQLENVKARLAQYEKVEKALAQSGKLKVRFRVFFMTDSGEVVLLRGGTPERETK